MKNFGNTSEDVIQLLEECNYEIINSGNPIAPIKSPFEGNILAIPK